MIKSFYSIAISSEQNHLPRLLSTKDRHLEMCVELYINRRGDLALGKSSGSSECLAIHVDKNALSRQSGKKYDLPALSQMDVFLKLVNNYIFSVRDPVLVCKTVTSYSWLIALGKWPLTTQQECKWNCFDYRCLGSLLNILHSSHILSLFSTARKTCSVIWISCCLFFRVLIWVYSGKRLLKDRQRLPNPSSLCRIISLYFCCPRGGKNPDFRCAEYALL